MLKSIERAVFKGWDYSEVVVDDKDNIAVQGSANARNVRGRCGMASLLLVQAAHNTLLRLLYGVAW